MKEGAAGLGRVANGASLADVIVHPGSVALWKPTLQELARLTSVQARSTLASPPD